VVRPETTIFSTGAYRLPGQSREYRDWRPGGHGHTNLVESLARSVNSYYYHLAVELGIERLSRHMHAFGFGAPTGIDLPGESAGIVPSPEWKRGSRNEPWYPGETVISGIGQGFWVTTPLQLAQGTAIIAARGEHHPLHLLRESQDGFGAERKPEAIAAPRRVVANREHLDAVDRGLVAVMHSPTGTARATAQGLEYLIAGKTGTAQRVTRRGDTSTSLDDLPFHLRHRALFMAYAPAEDPQLALALVVESGGSGSRAAAPVARRIFDAWLAREEGR
jgi:penicillin-binding protein 2